MKTSQKKFWEVLAKRAEKRGFKYREGDYWIREKRTGHCPVTAVCEEMTGVKYASHHFPYAADKIELDIDFANEVVRAADYRHSDIETEVTEGLSHPSLLKTRKKLLQTLGLEEK